MDKKTLIETNPYLQDSKKYRKALAMNVASSTAIETGASVESVANILTGKKARVPREPAGSVVDAA